MVKVKAKWKFWAVFLLALVGSVTISLIMRVFSFYTLPHYQKVLVLGYLGIVIGSFLFRFVHAPLSSLSLDRKKLILSVVIAIASAAIFFAVVPYHQAPIRTFHTLTITNHSSQFDLTLVKIKLPGNQVVDLPAEYPEAEIDNGLLRLPPEQSLTYSREMVGGVALTFSTRTGHPLEVDLDWDGRVQQISMPAQEELITVSLPDWTWGEPSFVYRFLGWVNIFADGFSLVGILFCGLFWIFGRNTAHPPIVNMVPELKWLETYTTLIWVNIGCIVLAGLNQIVFPQSRTLMLLLFLVGVLVFIADIFRRYPRWVLRIVIGVLVIGIGLNINLIFHPTNPLYLAISMTEDDSFIDLAQRAGGSTYFSMGYYRYLRGAILHIPKPLMEELDLYTSRLEKVNIGLKVVNDPYDYVLTLEEADQLFENHSWEEWPKRGGGDYYLYPESNSSPREYYVLKSENQYFLVTPELILETGMIDDSILN